MCPAKPKIFITCPLHSLLTPAVRDYKPEEVWGWVSPGGGQQVRGTKLQWAEAAWTKDAGT